MYTYTFDLQPRLERFTLILDVLFIVRPVYIIFLVTGQTIDVRNYYLKQ